MQNTSRVIAVDGGGIFIGDLKAASESIPSGSVVYEELFCTPIRRARQLSSGNGMIVECDDGLYEAAFWTSPEERANIVDTEILWSALLYFRIKSGELTICDAQSLSTRDAIAARDDSIDPAHAVRIQVLPGCYQAELTGVARAARGTEGGFRLLFTKEDEAKWMVLYKTKLSGQVTTEQYDQDVQVIVNRARRVVIGITLTLMMQSEIPDDYDPAELVLELPKLQFASRFLRSRAK